MFFWGNPWLLLPFFDLQLGDSFLYRYVRNIGREMEENRVLIGCMAIDLCLIMGGELYSTYKSYNPQNIQIPSWGSVFQDVLGMFLRLQIPYSWEVALDV